MMKSDEGCFNKDYDSLKHKFVTWSDTKLI
jgi:hypothetical protein